MIANICKTSIQIAQAFETKSQNKNYTLNISGNVKTFLFGIEKTNFIP